MSDLTYTAQGTFDRNRNAIINVCIPPEPKPGTYITDIYNLSKITSFGSINAIFCYFSDGTENAMQWNSFEYKMNFSLDRLKNHPGAVDFDENKDDALFIFFHNNIFNKSDRDGYFEIIEEIYNDVKHNGNQNQETVSTTNETFTNPRKVGMSLILKRIK